MKRSSFEEHYDTLYFGESHYDECVVCGREIEAGEEFCSSACRREARMQYEEETSAYTFEHNSLLYPYH